MIKKYKGLQFPNTMKIVHCIIADYQKYKHNNQNENVEDLFTFALLISGISSSRKAPGIEKPMGFEVLYKCNEHDSFKLKEYLKTMYNIVDSKTFYQCCKELYSSHQEYLQFMQIWQGNVQLNTSKMPEKIKIMFKNCCAYAKLFYPILKEKGFYAWDANEIIGLARKAYACGILEEQEVQNYCIAIAKSVSRLFNNWYEFSLSCLCGALYFNYRNSGNDEDVDEIYQLYTSIFDMLFNKDGIYHINGWYSKEEKRFILSKNQIKQILDDWQGADGCIASDRILVDGCKVGYMYREKSSNKWDSGWRFLAGDETNEYLNNSQNSGIYKLNTVCNYDYDIIPFLNDEEGCVYARKEDNLFHKI